METYAIPSSTRDISGDVLGKDGRMRILPASFWAEVTDHERTKFCLLNGVYSIPTVELVDYLREAIGGRKAIEIGAGNGVLAEALGIIATDSKQQEKLLSRYSDTYGSAQQGKQPPVIYGSNVVEAPADRALRIYRPEVVIGCWVTHKYDVKRAWLGGNERGVVEEDILASCEEYVFVGNTKIHRAKPIMKMPHSLGQPSWLYSRALNGTPNFIARWTQTGDRAAA